MEIEVIWLFFLAIGLAVVLGISRFLLNNVNTLFRWQLLFARIWISISVGILIYLLNIIFVVIPINSTVVTDATIVLIVGLSGFSSEQILKLLIKLQPQLFKSLEELVVEKIKNTGGEKK